MYSVEDGDACSPLEMDQLFPHKYQIHDEMALSLSEEYIVSLCKDKSLTRIAAGSSGASVNLFDLSSERGLSHFVQLPLMNQSKTKMQICGVCFVDETPNLLLVGTRNGVVRLFDLRTQKEQARFENELKGGGSSTIVSFDRNANSRLLCTGAEHTNDAELLVFYDMRERKRMGSYFDSHQDDVTALRFHPQNPDILASGSTDGLINIFDLREAKEEDALLITINTESSVHKLNWHKNVYEKDIISCITHTNDFKTYESNEGDLIAEFEWNQITKAIKRTSPANCNLIDAHNTSDNGVFLLAGSNMNKGDVMRTLRLQNKELLPFANYNGNKQIVRESVFDPNTNVLITAGESCIVTLWTPCGDAPTASSGTNKLKVKTTKTTKVKPY